ncbi:hypothetical protein, partial [Levilactobacillus parabrevis]|uniref:hypothetical protein n=1 Tax=Levilactobacillus parabrevis TaxID=357278 RepID=UPI0005263A7E
LWLLNIIREGIPYFYTIQKSFMHLHKIFYALVNKFPNEKISNKKSITLCKAILPIDKLIIGVATA